jgi:hypothetical protein
MEGRHRSVSCTCGMAKVARQVLVAKVIEDLKPCFEKAPDDGKLWISHVLRERPDLAERLRKCVFPTGATNVQKPQNFSSLLIH